MQLILTPPPKVMVIWKEIFLQLWKPCINYHLVPDLKDVVKLYMCNKTRTANIFAKCVRLPTSHQTNLGIRKATFRSESSCTCSKTVTFIPGRTRPHARNIIAKWSVKSLRDTACPSCVRNSGPSSSPRNAR